MPGTIEIEKNSSSLELLWRQAFQFVDMWANGETHRESVLLQTIRFLADNLKQSKTNINDFSKHISNELYELERASREEILMSTTVIQRIFPFRSFEEINNRFDKYKNQTYEAFFTTIDHLTNDKLVEKYICDLEKYIEFKRNNRNQFMEYLKETSTIFQPNQYPFINQLTTHLKNLLFPFNSYMERSYSYKCKEEQT
ncbi:hypothetical protein ACFWM3_08635 [Gottfriedia sp. NPDC058432]|uniref:hypothetical protein n=1 Tax=Gottfriedia sp. NPDC058432 TaxID=3346497 RepID=UPI0036591F3A